MSIRETADYLFELRRDNRRVDGMPPELAPATLADGYAAQALLVEELCTASGTSPAGYKIALTNTVAQGLMGVGHPLFGVLLADRVHPSGVTLPAADYSTRIVEVEFAFEMAEDAPASGRPYDRESIAGKVASMHPALEIVDHRFAALDRFAVGTLAADNVIHGFLVLGPAAPDWRTIDLAAHPVSLLVDGAPVLTGAGDRALGHPLEALAWLANHLPDHARALRAGDVVTTGLATDGIYEASAGESLRGEFGALGQVDLSFS